MVLTTEPSLRLHRADKERAIARDYAAIAAARITTPERRAERKPRALIYGRNKKGKTRLTATAPRVLILDPESGTDYERKLNPDIWHASSWDDCQEFYEFMKNWGKNPAGDPYVWIGLDGLTKIHNLALTWVRGKAVETSLTRKPEAVTTPDYGKAGELLKGFLHNLHMLGHVGIVITAQERMIEVEADDSESDPDDAGSSYLFVPDLPKGTRAAVNAVVDVIGRIYTVKIQSPRDATKEIVERRLWLAPSTKYDTGYRSEFTLPDMLRAPTIPRLETLLRTGRPAAPKTDAEPTPTQPKTGEKEN